MLVAAASGESPSVSPVSLATTVDVHVYMYSYEMTALVITGLYQHNPQQYRGRPHPLDNNNSSKLGRQNPHKGDEIHCAPVIAGIVQ